MENSFTKKLIKIDLAVYCIASIALFIGGILMITRDIQTNDSKNFDMGIQILGVFVLLIGIAMGILTFIKIRETTF